MVGTTVNLPPTPARARGGELGGGGGGDQVDSKVKSTPHHARKDAWHPEPRKTLGSVLSLRMLRRTSL